MIVAVVCVPIVQMSRHDIVGVVGVRNWFVSTRWIMLMRSFVRVARMSGGTIRRI